MVRAFGISALMLLFASACTSDAPRDASMGDDGTPAACTGCPRDCCRIADGGFACMNWSTRNTTTFECHCGSGPACADPTVCCPPDNQPREQLAPVCLPNPSGCDPRPTPGM